MDRNPSDPGRLQRAPESFIDRDGVRVGGPAARELVGRHDFRAFGNTGSPRPSTVRLPPWMRLSV